MSPLRAIPAVAVSLVLAGLGLSMTGCAGFQPLYAAEGVSPKLSAVEVTQPDGRLGFLMRQSLTDSFARDRDVPPLYRLNFTNREVRVPLGINISNVASRYEVDLSTTYVLTEIATGRELTRGIVSVNVTYDVQNQPYATLTAAQDGERRAAEQAADRLRLELATYFASPRPTPAASELAAAPTATYADRTAGVVVQTPRQQATDELNAQDQPNLLGQPRGTTVTPDQAQPFSAPQDPNNAPAPNTVPAPVDPSAIKTLPDQ